VVPEDLSIEAT
jgi:hypothetical protein